MNPDMTNTNLSPNHDPYALLAANLSCGDAINGWLLSRPRRKIVQLLKGQRVLDVCCGTGSLTAMLAASGCRAVGVDGSPTMLSYARRNRVNAEFKLLDATRLPFDREFDAAVISLALHEMPPPVREAVWASMRNSIVPGGHLIALDYALPRSSNLWTRIALSLIDQDEHSFVSIHREHYENFQEFMEGGGLGGWVQQRSEPLESVHDFWGGVISVSVCRRS